MGARFGIASDRVLVHHSSKPGLVVVEDGLIVDLVGRSAVIGAPVVDVGHQVLMPALVDTNVHVAIPVGLTGRRSPRRPRQPPPGASR